MNQARDMHPPLRSITEVRENTFIFEKRGALPLDICSEMIRRFEQHGDEQYEGRLGQQAGKDRSIKKSTDLVVSGKPHWQDIETAVTPSSAPVPASTTTGTSTAAVTNSASGNWSRSGT
jgi:hypothetical protein